MEQKYINAILNYKLKKEKTARMTVTGTSMNPILRENDVISIKTEAEYLPGDIIVYNYQREGRLVHRLLKTDSSVYLCKGDNCYRIEAIKKSDILGKVFYYIRNGKKYNINYNKNNISLLCLLSLKINALFLKMSLEDLHKSFSYKVYKCLFLSKHLLLNKKCKFRCNFNKTLNRKFIVQYKL